MANAKKESGGYDASSITVLEGLEAVRPEFREPGSRTSATAIEEALNNNQFTVLDQGTVQQLRAEFFFQLAQLLGQGRLRHVQDQGGTRQRTVVDNGNKIAQLA